MADYNFITYETLDDATIARIMLNRLRTRNAQNRGLLVELNDAMLAAQADDKVRVVILCGVGPIFSSGHDLGSKESLAERAPGPDQHPTFQGNGGTRLGAEVRWTQEGHFFFQNTLRWRNLRKITIAQAQGATFADVVGTRLGMCGVEYFAHPWEFGPRRTKEMLLTGDSIDADEACRLGMVSKVFPRDELEDSKLAYARRIAKTTTSAALMIKESVNQTVDNMGFYNALNACFTIHQMNHSHWAEIHEDKRAAGTPADGIQPWNEAPPVVALNKTIPDPHALAT